MPRLRNPSSKKLLFAAKVNPALHHHVSALMAELGLTSADVLAQALPMWMKAMARNHRETSYDPRRPDKALPPPRVKALLGEMERDVTPSPPSDPKS